MSVSTTQPTPSHAFAAEVLENGAKTYGGFAASRLLEEHPDTPDGFRAWRDHLRQRTLELAAAVGAGEPRLLLARIEWSRRAALARQENDDVQRLALVALRDVLREDLPDQARPVVEGVLEQALDAFGDPIDPSESYLDPSRPLDHLALSFIERVLDADPRSAIESLVKAKEEDGVDAMTLYSDVLMPAQREVGRLWHLGELRIAEEHLVTSATERAMAVLCHRSGPSHDLATPDRLVLSAAVELNVHDLGVRAVADFFEMSGWRSIFLGADVPVGEMAVSVEFFDADLVVLSATLVSQVKATRRSIEAIRRRREGVPIMVGGLAFDEAPELWQSVGADAYSPDLASAVALGEELVNASRRTGSAVH